MSATSFPLVDLHRHLDGNVRPSTILSLSRQYNLPLISEDLETLSRHVQIQDRTSDLVAFISKLEHGTSVMVTLDACRRIAYENVEDAFREGLAYAELRFSPLFMAQQADLPIEGVIESVIDGVRAGVNDVDIQINLIGILSRTYGVSACFRELRALLAYRDALVAVDLAGDEAGFPGSLFTEHFKRVRDAGLNVTIHAGEAAGPQSVWQAVNDLGASRIGHGVAAVSDRALMDVLASRKIGIESCLTSNYQTGAFTDTRHHPIHQFLAANIPVTLNTDDPGVSAITIETEYALASSIGIDSDALEIIRRNGIEQAFLSDTEKNALIDRARRSNLR